LKFAAMILMMFTLNSHAKDVECESIAEFQIKMDAHASNYQNTETTRTPEGGAYKYKKVICQKTCKIFEAEIFIQKYLPNHPDADKDGYVTYPYIDKQIEKAFISTYAKSLVMASKLCPTEIKGLETKNGLAVLMKYTSGNIVSDAINFELNGGVVSWVRQTKNGESKIVNL